MYSRRKLGFREVLQAQYIAKSLPSKCPQQGGQRTHPESLRKKLPPIVMLLSAMAEYIFSTSCGPDSKHASTWVQIASRVNAVTTAYTWTGCRAV